MQQRRTQTAERTDVWWNNEAVAEDKNVEAERSKRSKKKQIQTCDWWYSSLVFFFGKDVQHFARLKEVPNVY